MVREGRFRRVLPIHAPSLEWGDYWLYLRSPFTPTRDQALSLNEVWEPLLGPRQIIPTPTGRQALWEFLQLADLREGDEVLVSAYNFYVIVQMLIQRKLVPVFVDIDPETLCMDPKDLLNKLTDRSRLVIVTHLFGHPTDLDRIALVCQEHQLLLFEDCAHAVGTRCGLEHVGTLGDGALFSFGIYKTINTFGGGMLVLRPSSRVQFLQPVISEGAAGLTSAADHVIRCVLSVLLTPRLHTLILYPLMRFAKRFLPGLYELVYPSKNNPNYVFRTGDRAPFKLYMTRMIERQLDALELRIARRRAIIYEIKTRLSGLQEIRVLDEDKHGRANGAYFGLYVPDPEGLARHLETQGILSNPHEYYDCSQLPQFSAYRADCEEAAYAAEHLLRIPNFPSLRDGEVERIVESIRTHLLRNAVTDTTHHPLSIH